MITSQGATGAGYVTLSANVRDLYSKEVLFLAQPRLRFLQFAKIKEDLTATRGKSIVFVKYDNLAGGGYLNEDESMTPQGMASNEITISVKEVGNSVQVTELLLRTSLLDTLGDASKLLANNLAIVLDGQFRDTVLATTNIVYGAPLTVQAATGAYTSGASRANAAAVVANDALTSVTIKDAVELLAVNNAPKFNGDFYVCFAHPHQLRQLRDDANWVEAHKYMGRRQLYLGEVGMYEGVIFIETTQMPYLTSTQVDAKYGTSGGPRMYEGVIFGENSFAWAVALPVELRDDGVVDMGRKHTLGWYGIWGTGIIEGKNIVRLVTA